MPTTKLDNHGSSTRTDATTPVDSTIILDINQLVPLLARRSCHLPGNDWRADWVQWFCNNHILFGICLHHPWHPVERWERAVALAASISFSLVATNVVYLMHVRNPEQMETEILSYSDYAITYGMVLLWTLGGLCHSIFELIIWHVQACAMCERGGIFGDRPMSNKCKNIGSFLIIPVVLLLLGLAIYLVLLRASKGDENGRVFSSINYFDNNGEQDDQNIHDDLYVDVHDIDGIESFSFLLYSTVEMFLAWFIYFPLVGSLVFSGVLGCNGRLPILGGRPRDVRLVQEEQQQSSKYVEL